MFSDSRLRSLQSELETLHKAMTDARKEIERLQRARDSKLEQIRRDFDNDINSLERKYGTASSRIPDISRQIETRQKELERDMERTTANSVPQKRSAWL